MPKTHCTDEFKPYIVCVYVIKTLVADIMESSEVKETNGMVTKPLARVLYISRIFGIAPVSISLMSKIYIISPSRRYGIMSVTYFMLLLGVYIMDIVYNQFFVTNAKEIRVRTGVSLVIHMIHTVLFCGVMFVHALQAYYKMEFYVYYLNNIDKLNKELDNIFTNIRVKYANVIVGLPLSIINIVGSVYMYQRIKEIFVNNKDASIFIKQAIYFIWYNCIMLIQLRFMFIIFFLNGTIHVFRQHLEALKLKLKLFNSLENRTINTAYITIQRLCRSYTAICELVKKVEKQEGTVILSIFFYKLIDIMDALFLILSSFMSREHFTISFLTDNMLEMFWIIVRGTTVVILVEPCHQTRAKLDVLKIMISELLCISTNVDLTEELHKFSRLLLVNIPVFSPLGMFPFTRQQLVFLSSMLFTFMVITTQFRLRDQIGNQLPN